MDLSRNTYVITGATSGIGLSTANLLARTGAAVIGIGRNPVTCRQMEQVVCIQSGNNRVRYLSADLSQLDEIRNLVPLVSKTVMELSGRLELTGLVNNAGIFTYWMKLTPDGIETQWAVNHLAGFLLTNKLLPLLRAAPKARVITISSASHYKGRINWDDPQLRRNYFGLHAYENTKLANVLFTEEFNRRQPVSSTVRAYALDPGLVKTDIGMKGTPSIAAQIWKWRRVLGVPPEVPAQSIVNLLAKSFIQDSPASYWKDGKPKSPSKRAQSDYDAERLWKYSEQLCGMQKEENRV